MNPELELIAHRQDSVVTRVQLRRAGVTDDRVRAQLTAGRWREINGEVICMHNGPLTPGQGRWAVVVSAQGPRALSGLTVLEIMGVSGFSTPTVHVLVQRGAKVLPVPSVAVRVHESRRFQPDDVIVRVGLPMTSLERAAVDAAVWSADLLTASRILVAPVQQRYTTPGRLAETLEAAGRVRFRKVLHQLLTDLDGGAEALSEVAFLRWCRRHGFRAPTVQVRLDLSGRRRYLDAVFARPDGRRVLVEIDGGIHLTLAARWKDTAKDNDAAIAGELTLRFPSIAIYRDDPDAVRQLRQALASVRPSRGYGAA